MTTTSGNSPKMKSIETPWPRDAKPVIVGGTGGSGTRVVAQILMELGYYMGADFNGRPLDNLWFTLLFKRPKWYRRVRHDKAQIFQGLRIMEAAMRGGPVRSAGDKAFVLRAMLEHAFALKNPPADNGRWPVIRAWKMLVSRPQPPKQCRSWGWKEPCTHIYLDQIAEHFPTGKYILTIRHGLDMAFSNNQQMLDYWGWVFDVKQPDSAEEMPRRSLEYWIKSHQCAVDVGRKLGDRRFMLLNFDQLCVSPEATIRGMLDFLEIDPKQADLARLAKIPSVPKSAGRYREHDLSQFPPEAVESVRNFGFEVCTASAGR